MTPSAPFAYLGGRWASDLIAIESDLGVLDTEGLWAVVIAFDGAVTCARFATVRNDAPARSSSRWAGVDADSWTSSLSEAQYTEAVEGVRADIARGEVYQANICRVLTTDRPVERDPRALLDLVIEHHPAPYACAVHLPDAGVSIVSASPELYLGRAGTTVESRPIKGTAAAGENFLPKDRAENVMIVDLVRNDLGAVAVTGGVDVPALCEREEHPGLAHLVSTVRARIAPDTRWRDVIAATFPPGSVTGAPKHTALQSIAHWEPVPRGPYCGAIGWVDADARTASLAVGIRTFWWDAASHLNFGTGAGITWASDPHAEWRETELKARQLLALLER